MANLATDVVLLAQNCEHKEAVRSSELFGCLLCVSGGLDWNLRVRHARGFSGMAGTPLLYKFRIGHSVRLDLHHLEDNFTEQTATEKPYAQVQVSVAAELEPPKEQLDDEEPRAAWQEEPAEPPGGYLVLQFEAEMMVSGYKGPVEIDVDVTGESTRPARNEEDENEPQVALEDLDSTGKLPTVHAHLDIACRDARSCVRCAHPRFQASERKRKSPSASRRDESFSSSSVPFNSPIEHVVEPDKAKEGDERKKAGKTTYIDSMSLRLPVFGRLSEAMIDVRVCVKCTRYRLQVPDLSEPEDESFLLSQSMKRRMRDACYRAKRGVRFFAQTGEEVVVQEFLLDMHGMSQLTAALDAGMLESDTRELRTGLNREALYLFITYLEQGNLHLREDRIPLSATDIGEGLDAEATGDYGEDHIVGGVGRRLFRLHSALAELYAFADQYDMPVLSGMVEGYLTLLVNHSNLSEILTLVCRHSNRKDGSLMRSIVDFLCREGAELEFSEEFVLEHPTAAVDLLTQLCLRVHTCYARALGMLKTAHEKIQMQQKSQGTRLTPQSSAPNINPGMNRDGVQGANMEANGLVHPNRQLRNLPAAIRRTAQAPARHLPSITQGGNFRLDMSAAGSMRANVAASSSFPRPGGPLGSRGALGTLPTAPVENQPFQSTQEQGVNWAASLSQLANDNGATGQIARGTSGPRTSFSGQHPAESAFLRQGNRDPTVGDDFAPGGATRVQIQDPVMSVNGIGDNASEDDDDEDDEDDEIIPKRRRKGTELVRSTEEAARRLQLFSRIQRQPALLGAAGTTIPVPAQDVIGSVPTGAGPGGSRVPLHQSSNPAIMTPVQQPSENTNATIPADPSAAQSGDMSAVLAGRIGNISASSISGVNAMMGAQNASAGEPLNGISLLPGMKTHPSMGTSRGSSPALGKGTVHDPGFAGGAASHPLLGGVRNVPSRSPTIRTPSRDGSQAEEFSPLLDRVQPLAQDSAGVNMRAAQTPSRGPEGGTMQTSLNTRSETASSRSKPANARASPELSSASTSQPALPTASPSTVVPATSSSTSGILSASDRPLGTRSGSPQNGSHQPPGTGSFTDVLARVNLNASFERKRRDST